MNHFSKLALTVLSVCSLGLAACGGDAITETDPIDSNEGPTAPSESPVEPETPTTTEITVTHDVFSISGRGYFLTLQFSEPVKTETATLKLQLLTSAVTQEGGDIAKTYQDLEITESQWDDDRKSLSIRIPTTPQYGSYLFTLKASGDVGGHQADASFEFSIDQDSDGVVDKKDLCPQAPADTETGCPALPAPPTPIEDSDVAPKIVSHQCINCNTDNPLVLVTFDREIKDTDTLHFGLFATAPADVFRTPYDAMAGFFTDRKSVTFFYDKPFKIGLEYTFSLIRDHITGDSGLNPAPASWKETPNSLQDAVDAVAHSLNKQHEIFQNLDLF